MTCLVDDVEELLIVRITKQANPHCHQVLAASSQELVIKVGLIAGCTSSTSLARAYLNGITSVMQQDEHCRLAEHVDDMAQEVFHKNELTAKLMAVDSVKALG